jgi:hypothetical protein
MAQKTGARKASEPKLLGAAEVADALGKRQSNIRSLSGLPEPYDGVRATKLWRESDIEAFAKERGLSPVLEAAA